MAIKKPVYGFIPSLVAYTYWRRISSLSLSRVVRSSSRKWFLYVVYEVLCDFT